MQKAVAGKEEIKWPLYGVLCQEEFKNFSLLVGMGKNISERKIKMDILLTAIAGGRSRPAKAGLTHNKKLSNLNF